MDQKNTWHFFLNKNLVFIDSMQFMNSSLDKLVKNLSDEDFKYLVEEFGSENLVILKQKRAYSSKYMIILKDLMKINYLQENASLVQQKKERLIMMVK